MSIIGVNYIYVAVIVAVVLLAAWMLLLEMRLKKLFRGKKAKDLESVMLSINEELKQSDISREEVEKCLMSLEKRLNKSVQNVGVVRFNPFGDAGSNQSFAIALLDENENGVVLSGLYARDKINVFAKPIEKGVSQYALTKEEKEAIKATRLNEK